MRDPKVEQWLGKSGIPWHYEEKVPISEFNEEASLKNQARYKAINRDYVLELAISLLDGYELPALIAYRKGKRKFIIISGNHRFMAHREAQINNIDLYVVDTEHPWIIDRLTREANVLETRIPLTRDERIQHSIYMYRNLNMTIEDAAKAMRLPRSALSLALRSEEVRERLMKLGFEQAGTISPTARDSLWRIKQDSALLQAAKLVIDAKLNTEEAADLGNRLKKAANTQKAQNAVILEFCKKYAGKIELVKEGKVIFRLGPRERLNRALNTIQSVGGRPESLRPLEDIFIRKIYKSIKILEGLTYD